VERLLVILGTGAGGWAGWAVGARFGPMAAFLLSVVGTGVGLYVGRRIAREHF
jgi:hypothetical protein